MELKLDMWNMPFWLQQTKQNSIYGSYAGNEIKSSTNLSDQRI